MKFIKLFLASFIVEFESERKELGDYIRSFNDIYIKRGIYFELTICEDLSNAIANYREAPEIYRRLAERSPDVSNGMLPRPAAQFMRIGGIHPCTHRTPLIPIMLLSRMKSSN